MFKRGHLLANLAGPLPSKAEFVHSGGRDAAIHISLLWQPSAHWKVIAQPIILSDEAMTRRLGVWKPLLTGLASAVSTPDSSDHLVGEPVTYVQALRL